MWYLIGLSVLSLVLIFGVLYISSQPNFSERFKKCKKCGKHTNKKYYEGLICGGEWVCKCNK